jgi:hypothetical protein
MKIRNLFAGTIVFALLLEAQGQPVKIEKQTFRVQLNNGLGTATSHVNDEVTAVVMEPQDYLGWQMIGKIKKLTPAKRGSNKPAALEFEFESLARDRANMVPVRADVVEVTNSKGIKGVDDEGNIVGHTSSKKKVAGGVLGAMAGAGVGYAAGGAAGAAIGGIAGAAAGYALVKMTTKAGQDIRFEKGANFALEVTSHGKPGQTARR